jgi:hypothetical protein
VRIEPNVPKRDTQDNPVGSLRIDFKLNHPQKVDLDVQASHGNVTLPEIDVAATLNNRHGKTIFAGASGNVSIKQHHRDITVQHAGFDLSIDAHHSNASVDTVSGSATIQTHRGNLSCRSIGGNAS